MTMNVTDVNIITEDDFKTVEKCFLLCTALQSTPKKSM